MNLLDLMVKIGVDDQASKEVGGIGASITKKLGSAVKTVGKVTAAGVAAAGAGAIAMTKAATESYAAYEQLSGGVAKLYGNAGMSLEEYAKSVGRTTDEVAKDWKRNEDAQNSVLKHAMEGYRTSGMSMNQYMEQATSFSAALINSLGGDTAKAAEQTDVAMRAISDNVNTFGSDMGSVQMAFQGFAKQNYTMLDNLKLGYGGTKSEMERLIQDANAWGEANGKASDLSIESFSDVVTAIQQIQEKQGIAGTTAKEAMSTIEGSVNATKAAWENLLAAFGSGDQEQIDSAVTGIMDGIFGAVDEQTGKREGGIIANVVPVVQRVGEAIVNELPSVVGSIATTFLDLLGERLGMGKGWSESIMTTLDELRQKFEDFASGMAEGFGDAFSSEEGANALEHLKSVAEDVWTFIDTNILQNGELIGSVLGTAANAIQVVADAITSVMDVLSPFVPAIAAAIAAVALIAPIAKVITLVSGAFTFLTTVIVPAMGMVQSFGGAIALLTTLLGGPITILVAVGAAIVAFVATNEDARNAIVDAWNAVVGFFEGLPEWWGGVWESITKAVGEFVDGVTEKWDSLVKDATNVWEAVRQVAVANVLKLVMSVVGRFRSLSSTARRIWDTIKSGISNAINTAKDTVVSAAARMYDGIREKFGSALDYIKSIPQKAKDALGNLGNTLYSAGTSLLSGFLDGIKRKWNDAANFLGGIAAKAKKLKGPLPYDRKVLVENGEALMYGFQKGLSIGYERDVAPYLSGIAGDINSAMTFGAGGTMQGKAIGGGDVYNVYLTVEGTDYDQMAVAFTDAIRTRSMLAGRTSTVDVRRR